MTDLQKKRAKLTSRKDRKEFWDGRRKEKELRETLISEQIAEGLSDKEISASTGISERTIFRRRRSSK